VLPELSKVCNLRIYRHDNMSSFVVVPWLAVPVVAVHRSYFATCYTGIGLTVKHLGSGTHACDGGCCPDVPVCGKYVTR
jgi:hypothetical protein